jgi:hypothetical protein
MFKNLKKRFPIKSISILLFIMSAIAMRYFILSENSGIYCSTAVYDLGQLSIQNGQAIGEHIFQIENKTGKDLLIDAVDVSCGCVSISMDLSKLHPNEKRPLFAKMQLPREQIAGKTVNIIVRPRSDDVKPLILTLNGRPAVTTFFSKNNIRFGTVKKGNDKSETIFLLFPSNKILSNTIKKIEIIPHTIAEVSQKQFLIDKTENGNLISYLHKTLINIKLLDGPLLESQNTAMISVTTIDDVVHTVPIYWNFVKWTIFEPSSFILKKAEPTEKQTFQIVYNWQIGGTIKIVKTNTSALIIKSVSKLGNAVLITVEYSPAQSNEDEKIGEIIVEAVDGRRNIMEVLTY